MLPSHDMRLRVPVDDTLTHSYWIRFHPKPDAVFELETRGYSNKKPGEYPMEPDGFWNIPSMEQDRVAQETQGDITDRSKEHLAESDRGVILLRKKLREMIDAVAAGQLPYGVVAADDPKAGEILKFETTLSEKEYLVA
jgi:hypothetical protein